MIEYACRSVLRSSSVYPKDRFEKEAVTVANVGNGSASDEQNARRYIELCIFLNAREGTGKLFVFEANAVRSITFFVSKCGAKMAVFSAYNFSVNELSGGGFMIDL